MPVPDFQSLMLPVLKALSDGRETSIAEVREHVAAAGGLTQEDLGELLPSGRQSVFVNRIAWAVTHMGHAGLMEKIRRGVYRLTSEGEILLAKSPPKIDLKVLQNYSAYVDWRRGKGTSVPRIAIVVDPPADTSLTPEEAMECAAGELEDALVEEVLERVQNSEPAFLERVVVDLLIAMGYGGGDSKKGRVTGGSGDGGIDGTIREDALGLDEVYLQAKKYAPGKTVGENDLRSFAGAIDAANTTKGVFVTTASFTSSATAYVGRSPKRIVLIDGKELARLMVEHGIGVRLKMQYKVNRIDEDYFDAEAM